jgi:hypothetical protein
MDGSKPHPTCRKLNNWKVGRSKIVSKEPICNAEFFGGDSVLFFCVFAFMRDGGGLCVMIYS